MLNNRRKVIVNEDLYSICATRTLLNLGCENCVACNRECRLHKKVHNGKSPYDSFNKILADERKVKEND